MEKIIDLENDGVNMAVGGQCLYIRCKRTMYKYSLPDMRLLAHNTIFKKDGKARGFSIYKNYIFLTDFCDLYILQKEDLRVIKVIPMGSDLSSDLGAVRFASQKAYVGIRNGKIAVLDIHTRSYEKYDLCDSSFWDFCIDGNCMYAGTVQGELLAIDTTGMTVNRKAQLCKKNIYSVVLSHGFLYTVSQDMTIKAADAVTFEAICTAKKAVKGMAKILGIHKGCLVIADSNKITLWDRQTLTLCRSLAFPTGAYNKGVILSGGSVFGSDYGGIYSAVLE